MDITRILLISILLNSLTLLSFSLFADNQRYCPKLADISTESNGVYSLDPQKVASYGYKIYRNNQGTFDVKANKTYFSGVLWSSSSYLPNPYSAQCNYRPTYSTGDGVPAILIASIFKVEKEPMGENWKGPSFVRSCPKDGFLYTPLTSCPF